LYRLLYHIIPRTVYLNSKGAILSILLIGHLSIPRMLSSDDVPFLCAKGRRVYFVHAMVLYELSNLKLQKKTSSNLLSKDVEDVYSESQIPSDLLSPRIFLITLEQSIFLTIVSSG